MTEQNGQRDGRGRFVRGGKGGPGGPKRDLLAKLVRRAEQASQGITTAMQTGGPADWATAEAEGTRALKALRRAIRAAETAKAGEPEAAANERNAE